MCLQIHQNIIYELIKEVRRPRGFNLSSFKRKIAKKYKIRCPGNVELLSGYHRLLGKGIINKVSFLEKILRVRPVRSLSGIVNVSVLTKPYPCPGKCIYCPSQKGIPKSYVSGEPAVERAKALDYHPYQQVQKRLQMLQDNGHPTDKVELRIIGGTWSYYPKRYQSWFVKECFRACNNFMSNVKCQMSKPHLKCQNLKGLQKLNEKAKCRVVGITVETRPDFIDIKEIKRMRELGITRVELGVQTLYDDVLKLNRRGHNVAATIEATRLLKNAGFKVSYQMMPNLPGSDFNKDIKMFEVLFTKPDFQPDLLKIYPLALVKNTPLYDKYKDGGYKPYSEKELIKLLMQIKQKVPYWCRIERIMRDIPSESILEGGAKMLNLREVAQKAILKRGLKCKCIRCREVRGDYISRERPYLFQMTYLASGAREIFLSFENKKRTKLYALLRLRLVPETNGLCREILPVLKDAAIIREVHTYGQMVVLGKKELSPQHRGLGKKLMQEAERIARSSGLYPVKSAPPLWLQTKGRGGAAKPQFNRVKKIAVISAVGTRDYYRQLGYRLKQTYMVKSIQ